MPLCSYTTLCEITGVSRPTVGRAIKLLKDDQWIDTVKIGNANAYCVNERVFWQAGRNQRKYAISLSNSYRICHRSESDFQEKAKQKLTYIPIIEPSDIPTTELTNYRRQTKGIFRWSESRSRAR